MFSLLKFIFGQQSLITAKEVYDSHLQMSGFVRVTGQDIKTFSLIFKFLTNTHFLNNFCYKKSQVNFKKKLSVALLLHLFAVLQLTVLHNHYHIIEPFTFPLTRAMYAFMHFILVILLIYAHLCKDTRYS